LGKKHEILLQGSARLPLLRLAGACVLQLTGRQGDGYCQPKLLSARFQGDINSRLARAVRGNRADADGFVSCSRIWRFSDAVIGVLVFGFLREAIQGSVYRYANMAVRQ